MEKLYLNKGVVGKKTLSGRPNGEKEREKLKLEEKDLDDKIYEVIIPLEIRTINPSYFLGLFSFSIKNLGLEKFRQKYNLIMENGKILPDYLINDVEEGIEWALDDSEILC